MKIVFEIESVEMKEGQVMRVFLTTPKGNLLDDLKYGCGGFLAFIKADPDDLRPGKHVIVEMTVSQ